MQLRKVSINNFRNIVHSEYDLKNTNIFTGPNRKGKTNTILAIYWAINDYLMDGSSNYPSFKPIGNENAEVSVELEFDNGLKLKKTYAENWVKTRGSSEVKLAGNVTNYFIDGIALGVTEAKKEIRKRFGVYDKNEVSKFDLLRCIVDPYYLAKEAWKTTREFIIEIVGDVSNDDVMDSDDSIQPVKSILEKYQFDTEKAKKFFKQSIASEKDDIQRLQNQVAGLELMKDVSKHDLDSAAESIKTIDKTIEEIRSDKTNASVIKALEQKKSEAMMKLREAEQSAKEALQDKNASVTLALSKKSKDMNACTKEISVYRDKMIQLDNDIMAKLSIIKSMKDETESMARRINQLRKDYERYGDSADSMEEVKCPHCGFVLNQESIDINTKNAENQMLECEQDGKQLKVLIENNKMKIAEAEKQLRNMQELMPAKKADYTLKKDQYDFLQKEYEDLQKTIKVYERPKEVLNIEDAINKLDEQIKNERYATVNDTSAFERIACLENDKKIHQDVIDAHAGYASAQKQIVMLNDSIEKEQKKQIVDEQSMILIDNFIQKKLELFNGRIKTVFKDRIEFVLIQKNIKEESWEECCYPTVLDKDTPFLSGSGSEQIMAGIYMAECIKQKLGLEDLPYIFDECDKLDSVSIKQLDTNSQIITTRVDDTHYNEVTLVSADKEDIAA